MGIFNKIKNFFKPTGGKKQMNNGYYNKNTLLTLYEEYQMSPQFLRAVEGEKYYRGENKINNRIMYRAESVIPGKYDTPDTLIQVPDDTQPNNHLSHNFAKALIDQKVDYSMSKPPRLTGDNDTYLEFVQQILEDNDFNYKLNLLGKKASCNGISWLHTYIENNQLKFMVIPATQVIPLWKDDLKQDVSAVIRVYTTINQLNPLNGDITVLEYWNEKGMQKFTIEGNTISPWLAQEDYDTLTQVDGAYNGQVAPDTQFNWGRVPFIPFKNNHEMSTDVQYIKNLIDGYDLATSDMANTLEQIADAILVVNNAQGDQAPTIQKNLKLYKMLLGGNADESGINAQFISPEINPEAINTHLQRLKENIIELSQSVNFDIDWTQPPSGVTLNILYRNLDIKCNGFESEFIKAFNMLQDLIKAYAVSQNQSFTPKDKVKITFIRDIITNTAEQIENLKNSKGQISQKTIMENHPFVEDPEEEYKQFNKELDEEAKRENFNGLDKVL